MFEMLEKILIFSAMGALMCRLLSYKIIFLTGNLPKLMSFS